MEIDKPALSQRFCHNSARRVSPYYFTSVLYIFYFIHLPRSTASINKTLGFKRLIEIFLIFVSMKLSHLMFL
jgi:hypothetical protein